MSNSLSKRDPTVNVGPYKADFSEDECWRRTEELIRRACGAKPTFSFETGQPFEGPQLTPEELRRRGYDAP